LAKSGVGVEKLFLGKFNSEIRSQVIESSFAVGAEIHRNYWFGSFFNSHRRCHKLAPSVRPSAGVFERNGDVSAHPNRITSGLVVAAKPQETPQRRG
jgi:hypothetical protein